ncbi:MAG: hypothetical protein H6729_11880 [Deltaproteobacteria bacterium]|nr:hypothetical protein [Deltaproteobacteria bacterium]
MRIGLGHFLALHLPLLIGAYGCQKPLARSETAKAETKAEKAEKAEENARIATPTTTDASVPRAIETRKATSPLELDAPNRQQDRDSEDRDETEDKTPLDYVKSDALGDLHYGMDLKEVVKIFGPPESTAKAVFSEEREGYLKTIGYASRGTEIEFLATKKEGPFSLVSARIEAPSKLATKRGIKIGSNVAELSTAYGQNGIDSTDEFIFGSQLGGVVFTLRNNRVTEIYLGEVFMVP